MATGKTANEAEKWLVARLARALEAGEEATLSTVAELGLAGVHGARFSKAAWQLRQRARAQAPRASATEIELALGALWVLHASQAARDARVTQ